LKTWEQARQLIYGHFINGWANHLPYFIEGHEEPDLAVQTAPFVLLRVNPTRVTQLAMAGINPPKRGFGEVEITVFTPFTVGAKTRMDAVDRLSGLFAATGVGEIVFRDVAVLSLVEGKNWRSQVVVASFYFELSLTGV
jgi:hypothetical protein